MFIKIKFQLLFYFLFISGEIFSHPMHLTITNIDIKDDSLKVAIRIFENDFASALSVFNHTSKTDSVINNELGVSETIKNYIDFNFKISIQSHDVNLKYLGCRHDESSIWIYLIGNINSKFSSITIENKLLNNLYGDQRNMVIINNNKSEEGFEFSATETKKTITLVD